MINNKLNLAQPTDTIFFRKTFPLSKELSIFTKTLTLARCKDLYALLDNVDPPLLSDQSTGSVSSNYSAWVRSLFEVFPNWPMFKNSTHHASMHLFGATSAIGVVASGYSIHEGWLNIKKAISLGEPNGIWFSCLELLSALLAFAIGVLYTIGRYVGVKYELCKAGIKHCTSLTNPSKSSFGVMSIALYLCIPLYLLDVVIEWFKHPKNSSFGKKIENILSINYKDSLKCLKKQLLIDQESLDTKFNKKIYSLGKTTSEIDESLEKAATDYLKSIIKNNIKTLQNNEILGELPNLEEKMDALLDVDKQALRQLGRSVVKRHIQEQKMEKLRRLVGEKEAERIVSLLKKPAASSIIASDAHFQIQTIYDNILQENSLFSKKTFWSSHKKCILALIGTLAMVLFCIGCPLAFYLHFLICSCELSMAYKNICDLEKTDTEPGTYDRTIPILSISFAVICMALIIIYAGISLSIAPAFLLVLGWIFINCLQLKSINKRVENYIKALKNKKILTPKEYVDLYIYNQKSTEEVIRVFNTLEQSGKAINARQILGNGSTEKEKQQGGSLLLKQYNRFFLEKNPFVQKYVQYVHTPVGSCKSTSPHSQLICAQKKG